MRSGMPSVTPRAPDPRLARTTERLRATVLAMLASEGYHGVTIERVAAESGVARTTIYRRWASRAEMVFDLALLAAAPVAPPPDTGTVRGDLEALVDRMLDFVGDEPGRTVLPGLVGDLASAPALAAHFRETFVVTARPVFGAVVARAGATPGRTAAETTLQLQAMLLGTVFAWVHLMPEEPPPWVREQLVSQLLALLGR